MATLRDLMNLPDAIQNELEYRSTLKAEALAHRIVNKVTGSNMAANPYVHNPYHEQSNQGGGARLSQHISDTPRGKK